MKLVVMVLLLASVAGFCGAQWQQRSDAQERATLISRFPIVRADERRACEREFAGQIAGYKDLKTQMDETHELAAYTLRFLGDRARINDERQSTIIRQARDAAAAAAVAAKKTEVVEQKVNVATASAAEAASAARAVGKKLDSAVQPARSAQPWIGNRR